MEKIKFCFKKLLSVYEILYRESFQSIYVNKAILNQSLCWSKHPSSLVHFHWPASLSASHMLNSTSIWRPPAPLMNEQTLLTFAKLPSIRNTSHLTLCPSRDYGPSFICQITRGKLINSQPLVRGNTARIVFPRLTFEPIPGNPGQPPRSMLIWETEQSNFFVRPSPPLQTCGKSTFQVCTAKLN